MNQIRKEVNDPMIKLTVATLVSGAVVGLALARGRERMEDINELFRIHGPRPY